MFKTYFPLKYRKCYPSKLNIPKCPPEVSSFFMFIFTRSGLRQDSGTEETFHTYVKSITGYPQYHSVTRRVLSIEQDGAVCSGGGGGLIFSIVKNHNKISQDPYCNLYLHHCIIIKYSPIRIHIHSLEVGKLTNNSNSSRDYHVKFLYQDLHFHLMTELIPHILYST